MKKIAVIIPVGNRDIVKQSDLDGYQTADCYYELHYVDTDLNELNTQEDADQVVQPTIDKVMDVEQAGAAAALIFAFGDVAVKQAARQARIPVMGTGTYAVHVAAEICVDKFTILPGKLVHNQFIQPLVASMGLEQHFVVATHEAGLFPAEIRKDQALAIERLFTAACAEVDEQGVDTLTLGCGCFMGMAKPLQEKLQCHYQRKILVIDPGATALAIARSLV